MQNEQKFDDKNFYCFDFRSFRMVNKECACVGEIFHEFKFL